jgi:integrase/recombinase XerD
MNKDDLQRSLDSYLAIREALGFRMHTTRVLLTDFVEYLCTHNVSGSIRAQVAIDWATSGSTARGPGGQAARLSQVRGFLSFLRASVPETEIPDQRLLASTRRPLPYLFTPIEIAKLLEGAAKMRPQGSLRPILWQTLLGLLASTGLRVGEALRLKIDNVLLQADPPHLRIIETKFRKSRLVPLHPATAQRLRHYEEQRKRLGYDALSDCFFISERGKALDHTSVWLSFRRLTRRLGILPRNGSRNPCLQCLRHTFAVERLREWHRLGMNVQALIPNLSVYLGHLRPQETYWYLTTTPELLTAAAEKFQRYAGKEEDAS